VAAALLSPAAPGFRMPAQALYYNGLRDGSLEAYRRDSQGLQTVEQTQGFYGQVSVVRSGENLLLKSNGRTEASTAARDNVTQLLLGHLPMLFHPNPRRVLAIGLGGGITLRALTHHPEAQSITVAEIDPVVVEAARRWFTPYNDRALDDPRVRVVTNDGRNYIDATKERFDVITSAPPNIWVPGASGLFTEEFYRSAAAHLSAGGILCQWIPLSEMEKEDFRTMLHTITRAFPNVTFWKVGADVILLASREPFRIEQEPTVARLRNAALGQDFTAIGITMRGALQIMNTPIVRPEQVPAFLGNVETVNVDDKPVLEFSTARNLYELAKRGK
jgi:spermidine synthase